MNPSPLSSSLLRRFGQLICALFAMLLLPLAHGTVDEAHDYTMEAAKPFVDQGFTVREDYWNGEVASGQKLAIRHQLFKGNEYAFWLGTANDGCTLEIQVLDEKGNPVQITPKVGVGPMFTSVKVNPPKTGTYSILFSITSKTEKGVFWALAYGYR